MLTNLSLENFKSWKRIENMRLAPITGLFGTNSSGKTSILQFLLMLKQTIESTDRQQVLDFGDQRCYVELGTFRDVAYGHAKPGRLTWSLDFKLAEPLTVVDPETENSKLFEDDRLTFGASVAEHGGAKRSVRTMSYGFAGHTYTCEAVQEEASGYHLTQAGGTSFQFKRAPGRPWQLPPPVKFYGFPDQVYGYFQNAGFLADLQLTFERQFANLFYLGPLREYPRPFYPWAGAQPADVGQRGEKVVDAILSSRERGERISRGKGKSKLTLEEYIADWLHRLGLIDSFAVEPVSAESNLFQVSVRKTAQSTPVKITDVGFGISQIMPVIALCYYVPKGSTIIFEQPEIHLHPSAQAGLADVFIDAVRVRGVQIIVESHSEHLLRRLQRRIAEGKTLKNDDVSLYFCRFDGKESQLDPLDVDPYGNIRNWPEGFFGNEFEEMAETTLAAMKRKSKAPEKP
jgi:predicted ATPase